MISTSVFAERMDVNYRTALNWLRAGLVSGAIERKLPSGSGNYWDIPVTALQMEKPKPGPKKGTKRSATGDSPTVTTTKTTKQKRAKSSQKKDS